MSLQVKFAVRSETGYRRDNNEDNFFCNGIYMTPPEREKPYSLNGLANEPCIFAVFDGMGGHECGEVASLIAAETLAEYSEKIRGGAFREIDDYIQDATKRLTDMMRERKILTGTTIVLITCREDSFMIFHLGDSRAYRLKGDTLLKSTDDHTLAAEMVRMGMMSPRKAMDSPYWHSLTRFLGIEDKIESSPDVNGPFEYAENSRVLLCTDGLTDMLTHREISECVKAASDPAEAVNSLVDSALAKGGHDNVTCIVLDFVKGE